MAKRDGGWFQRGAAGCIIAQVASALATHWLVTAAGLMCAARSLGHCSVTIRWRLLVGRHELGDLSPTTGASEP